jgi:hypothetical protein
MTDEPTAQENIASVGHGRPPTGVREWSSPRYCWRSKFFSRNSLQIPCKSPAVSLQIPLQILLRLLFSALLAVLPNFEIPVIEKRHSFPAMRTRSKRERKSCYASLDHVAVTRLRTADFSRGKKAGLTQASGAHKQTAPGITLHGVAPRPCGGKEVRDRRIFPMGKSRARSGVTHARGMMDLRGKSCDESYDSPLCSNIPSGKTDLRTSNSVDALASIVNIWPLTPKTQAPSGRGQAPQVS